MFKTKNILIGLLVMILTIGVFCFVRDSKAESSNSGVDVILIAPGCGDGVITGSEQCDDGVNNGACPKSCSATCQNNSCDGGGGQTEPTDTTGPTITVSSITTTTNSATIIWNVTDSSGVASTVFNYGVSDYASSGTVVSLGSGQYQTTLNNLSSNTTTTYLFKINATDSSAAHNSSDKIGNFFIGQTILDIVPPTISDIAITKSTNLATINFNTSELSSAQINYGLNSSYGSTAESSELKTAHSLNLLNLLPNTTYHYRIVATDAAINSSSTLDAVFQTNPDITSPPNVTNLQISSTSNSIILTWVNPSLVAASDFSGVKILRKLDAPASGPNDADASVRYVGSNETFTDADVLVNRLYYFSIFSFDTSGNYSSGVYTSGKILPPTIKQEVCGNGIDDDSNGLIDCADSVCAALDTCQQKVEVCGNGIDDDSNGLIDCADSACVSSASCIVVRTEICNNTIDDDSNGLIDCADSACVGFSGCQTENVVSEICGNSIDDNNNGQTDCADSACVGFPGCVSEPETPVVTPTTTVPEFVHLTISDLSFWTGGRKIKLIPQDQLITNLAGADFTIGVPLSVLPGPAEKIILRTPGAVYQFSLVSSSGFYYVDLSFPGVGAHKYFVEVDYGSEQIDAVAVELNSLSLGQVTADSKVLSGVNVSLYGQDRKIVATNIYGWNNPQITNANGTFGWIVPNGRYFLTAEKDKYYSRSTPFFNVENNVVNLSLELVSKPPTLAEVIDDKSSLGENVKNVTKNLIEKTQAASSLVVQSVSDIKNDPVVQEAATNVATPVAVSATAVATVSIFSWLDILSLLRFLFLQPLMLLGKGKREKWGVVYSALNKLPIDLAIVRLIDAASGKVLKTKVTDGKGRYAFMVNAGEYRLEVRKSSMIFPSALLKNMESDGRRADIYHGEVIVVKEKDSVITANIPLDPVGVVSKPKRIIWSKILRHLRSRLVWLGLVVTLVSLYISPRWYMWVLLGVHLFLFFVFRRLARVPKVKGWGIVYDSASRLPVGKTVARLFDSQFNKLVATDVTDRHGRYYFLAGDSQYYVTYEHESYLPAKTENIDLSGKESDTIAKDIGLKKK